jgi:hypothetical protein
MAGRCNACELWRQRHTGQRWVGDGLSARVTGGVTVTKSRSRSLTVGGLGADYRVWTAKGRVFLPF